MTIDNFSRCTKRIKRLRRYTYAYRSDVLEKKKKVSHENRFGTAVKLISLGFFYFNILTKNYDNSVMIFRAHGHRTIDDCPPPPGNTFIITACVVMDFKFSSSFPCACLPTHTEIKT